MLKMKSSIWLVILLALVSLGIGCDGQTDEANKLVDEANATIKKNNELATKAGALTNELLVEGLKKAEDVEKHKTDNKAKFDELIKLNEDLAKGEEEAAGKFDQVSKMKLDDKFKEYNSLKAQELKKGAESSKAEAAFLKAFLAEKDADKISSIMEENNKKSADLKKESDGFKDKADKLVKDNPTIFKK